MKKMEKYSMGTIIVPKRCKHRGAAKMDFNDLGKALRAKELEEILNSDDFEDRYTIFEARDIIDEYAELTAGCNS